MRRGARPAGRRVFGASPSLGVRTLLPGRVLPSASVRKIIASFWVRNRILGDGRRGRAWR